MSTCCYYCHEPLPPLPEDATYVETINHVIHDECWEERDGTNRRREMLIEGIHAGSIDSIPDEVRDATLERIRLLGFSHRCPCLYDPGHGFRGYNSHSFDPDEVEVDYDERNSIDDCKLCEGSGTYDPLPQLLELTDDRRAVAWVKEHLPRSAGPCSQWPGFPEEGWYYDALGYNRAGKSKVRGVILYNPTRMEGGTITWDDIADLFRPRVQSSLF